MHSIETGEPSRAFLSGTDGFEHLRRDPELARIFDDAMTNVSQLSAPAIAKAYDFDAWGSLMDVGGGSGILLSHILGAHPGLRGVLADQEHVLARARERGYLDGDLATRTTMEPCNFFEQIPPGCGRGADLYVAAINLFQKRKEYVRYHQLSAVFEVSAFPRRRKVRLHAVRAGCPVRKQAMEMAEYGKRGKP
jgi:O-methyltransferase domain